MRITLLLAFSLLSFGLFAQSADKGKLLIDTDFGLSLYNLVTNDHPESGQAAAPVILGLSASYTTHDRVALGIEVRVDNFQRDTTTSNGGNTFNLEVGSGFLALKGQYHIMNREKSNLYLGTKAGVGGLNLFANDSTGNNGTLELTGTVFGVFAGYRKYFGKVVGFRTELSLVQQSYWGSYFEVNGQQQELVGRALRVEDYKAKLTGVNLTVGLTFNIGKHQ